MLTVSLLLAVAAFVCTIVAVMDRCPLWIPVMLLVLVHLLVLLPLR